MKNSVLIVVLLFFGFSINAQSLASYGLKGQVKSIQEELKICDNRYGKPQTKDCNTLTSEKNFTKEGYLSDYKDSLGSGNITREKVETPKGWLETVYKNEDGLKIKLAEHTYNKDNLMLKTISFDESGSIFSTTEYFYDEKGRNTKWERISDLNGVTEKRISFFDEFGSFSSVEMYTDDVLHTKENFDIQYKFDEQGNWVEAITFTDFSTDIQTRTIAYY